MNQAIQPSLNDVAEDDLRDMVPEHLHDALRRYCLQRIPPGDFLRSAIQNDLYMASLRADYINLTALPDIMRWLAMHAPAGSWGGVAEYNAWIGRTNQ